MVAAMQQRNISSSAVTCFAWLPQKYGAVDYIKMHQVEGELGPGFALAGKHERLHGTTTRGRNKSIDRPDHASLLGGGQVLAQACVAGQHPLQLTILSLCHRGSCRSAHTAPSLKMLHHSNTLLWALFACPAFPCHEIENTEA